MADANNNTTVTYKGVEYPVTTIEGIINELKLEYGTNNDSSNTSGTSNNDTSNNDTSDSANKYTTGRPQRTHNPPKYLDDYECDSNEKA